MKHSLTLFLSLIWQLEFFHALAARLVNITIDDSDAAVVYSPSTAWKFGPDCNSCTRAKPNSSLAHNETWHVGMHSATNGTVLKAEVSFTGTAVYVYSIVSWEKDEAATDITFLIDGEQIAGYGESQSDIDGAFDYNQLIFDTSSLPFARHTLTIVNGATTDKSADSFLMLDYIVYSKEDNLPTNTTTSTRSGTQTYASNTLSSISTGVPTSVSDTAATSRSHTPAIIGGVLGSCVGILVLWALFTIWRRRRNISTTVIPFVIPETGSTNAGADQIQPKIPPSFALASNFSALSHTENTPMSKDNRVTPTISATTDEEPRSETTRQVVPNEATLHLAAEVERLKEEVSRIREQRHLDGSPPPYLRHE